MDLTTFRVVRADRSHEATLAPLLAQYCREMEHWLGIDSDRAGVFTYPLEAAWNAGTHVYLAYVEELPAGFALVGSAQRHGGDPSTRDMVEFFITRRVRCGGIGRRMAAYVWHQYPGSWLVRVYQGNTPAMRFWASAISACTGGDFSESVRSIAGKPWSYFTFESVDSRPSRS
jgi:predicted acetyltransferase